jgi:aryl-alcohol dehydrogenase-like predicted oxidoreductase
MQFQELGNTGVLVSRICLGTMTFGGTGGVFDVIGGLGQSDADLLVNRALESGVNFFDTANIYSLGESEKLLGKALGSKRKDVVLATKVFGRMGPGANQVGLTRLTIFQEVENSLKRLGTDYIDLYQVHGFDTLTPIEETLHALNDLVRQGKIRYMGCSNWSAWQIMKALGISAQQHMEKFVSLQAYYSLAGRDLEHEIVPFLKDQRLGLLTWSPLAGGFLSGKFTRGGAKEDNARRMKFDFPPIDVGRAYDIVDALKKVASRYEKVTVAQVALSWQLHRNYVTSVIIGARKESQLIDNLGAANLKLNEEDLAEIDTVSRPTAIYPNWMFGFQQADRLPGATRDFSAAMKSTV